MSKLITVILMSATVELCFAQEEVPLFELTAVAVADGTRNGEVATEELVADLLRRIDEHAALNAFISVNRDAALSAAQDTEESAQRGEGLGALAGVPIVVKDNINMRGLPTTGGTPALAKFIPARNAPVLERLLAAGAIVLGKTNMHELAFGVTSNNARFGAVGNAYNPAYFAGGSSGGTAAAIAARLAPAGLGSDTGGSVRIPAALNGITGLRPTIGRYPQGGIIPISSTRDTAGPMARTVGDLVLLDNVITGYDQPIDAYALAQLRIGVPREPFWTALDADTSVLAEQVLDRLRAAGVEFINVDMAALADLLPKVEANTALYEARRELPRFLQTHDAGVTLAELAAGIASPDVKATFDSFIVGENAIPASSYREAMEVHRPALQALYRRIFSENEIDALIFPTTRLPARPIEQSEAVVIDGAAVPTFLAYIANTAPGSATGIPGLTVPIGLTSEGLPVGIALDGPAFSDRRLLSIGLAIENLIEPLPAPE